MRTVAIVLAGLVAASPAALGQAPGDRFQIVETADGVLRLDRVTGAVDLCTLGDAGWDCESVVEAAATPSRDVTETGAWRDLTAENARLKEEVARLERRLAMIAALVEGIEPKPASEGDTVEDARREIDRAVEVTGYALRSFRDLIRALEEEEAR